MQAWISGAPLWIFFQTLQYDRAQEIKKRVKFQKKKKKWVKWAILAKVWSKIVQVFISGYALKINFKVSSMIEHSKMIKSHLSETSKKSFFPDCVQNFETLYLRS